MTGPPFTCPCCGYKTLEEPPGSFLLCGVCFWEDDSIQLLDPAYRGGANTPSLMECQANFQRIGACEPSFLKNVRPPKEEEPRDPEWRPARESDLEWARLPRDLSRKEYRRVDSWYYWRRRQTGNPQSVPTKAKLWMLRVCRLILLGFKRR
ncbi:MAG: hypothetical protein DWQ01_03720 [Planctomycetota bacterium]|nr:MAG: hypothetical protein DWQ01_03720 [Planctomycetota bacterium]